MQEFVGSFGMDMEGMTQTSKSQDVAEAAGGRTHDSRSSTNRGISFS